MCKKEKLLVAVKNLCKTGDVDLILITPILIKYTTKVIPEGNRSVIYKVEVTKLLWMGGNIKNMDSYFSGVKKKHVIMNQFFWKYQKIKTTIIRIVMMFSSLDLWKLGTGGLTGKMCKIQWVLLTLLRNSPLNIKNIYVTADL